jgi:peroxiredoxin
MKQDIKQFTDRKAQIVVIAPHGTEKVETYWKRENLPYIGIPDPDGTLGKLYGQEWSLIKLGRMPALFIIDKKGSIAFTQYSKNMADIPKNNDLFKILEGLK